MSYNLIGYQKTAVDELTKKVTKLLHSNHKHTTCVFQSPTGSGKTIMTAKLIESILEDNQDTNIVFLWISIGKGELHKQSKAKLELVYEGFPPVNLVEERYFGDKHTIRPRSRGGKLGKYQPQKERRRNRGNGVGEYFDERW